MATYSGGTLLQRSDATGFNVVGSAASPVTLTTTVTDNAQVGETDVRDFTDIAYQIYITEKGSGGDGTATTLYLYVEFAEKTTIAGGDLAQQLVEDVDILLAPPINTALSEGSGLVELDIPAGAVPQSIFYTLPCFMPKVKVAGISADIIGTTPPTCYIRGYRKTR